MKLIVKEGQCAFLMKNGVFQRVLFAGQYRFAGFLGYAVEISDLEGEIDTHKIPLEKLMQDDKFAQQVVRVQIPDDSIALHYLDGRFCEVLSGREYLFWNGSRKHTFEMVCLADPEMAQQLPKWMWPFVSSRLYRKIEVGDGECALLYFDRCYQRTLIQGTYYFWNWNVEVSHRLIDLKRKKLEVVGQEILTADKVGVRISLLCNYRISDPVRLVERVGNLEEQLYTCMQFAARSVVGRLTLDELLTRKDALGGEILELLKNQQGTFCVEFADAGIRDVILPGEIREIMNTVLVAEKTAQANVITRREEVASTRSLLNTARLMDENQTLRRLKELEYLERICDRVGSISLTGAGNVLEQLGGLLGMNVEK